MRLLAASALLVASAPLAPAAQTGSVALSFADGVLGSDLDYTVTAPVGKVFLLIPSFEVGPTALALLDPTVSGTIAVGLDLFPFVKIKLAPGGVSYPLPADPSFAGSVIRAVALTVPGTTTFLDGVSSLTTLTLALPGTTHETLTPSVAPRIDHSLTQLADGRVVVLGGDVSDPGTGAVSISDGGELYDPLTQSFTDLGAVLTHPRSTHTATLLADGRILLAGGYDATVTVTSTAEIYDPATNTSVPVASMSTPRSTHTAVLLADGRVWVLGGTSLFDTSDPLATIDAALNTSEVFDPSTGVWSPGPTYPSAGIGAHTATRLANGKVLVAGGISVVQILFVKIPNVTAEALLYDPATNTFQDVANLPAARAFHDAVAIPGGRVLVAAGGTANLVTLESATHAQCWLFDQATNAWSATGSVAHPRAYHELVLAGSRVFAVGGFGTVDLLSGVGTPETVVEAFDLGLLAWSDVGAQLVERWTPRAAATEGGVRLVVIGEGFVTGGPAITQTADVLVVP